MAGFKSDRDGFLVGRPVSEDAAARVLRAIKGDTGQILAALRGRSPSAGRPVAQSGGGAASSSPASRSESTPSSAYSRATVSPRPRDSLGRFVAVRGRASDGLRAESGVAPPGATGPVASPSSTTAGDRAADRIAKSVEQQRRDTLAAERMRGVDGRFMGGDGEPKGGSSGTINGVLSGAAGAVSGAEQLDPIIGAASELKGALATAREVVAPIGRAFGFSPDREEKQQTGLLRKMWREMRDARKKKVGASTVSVVGGGGDGGGILGSLPLPVIFGIIGAALSAGLTYLAGHALKAVWDYFEKLDIAGTVRSAWEGLTTRIGAAWEAVTAKASEVFEPARRVFSAIADWVSKIPGMSAVKDVVSSAAQSVGNAASAARDVASDAVSRGVEAVKSGAARAWGWMSEKYESGGRGAATVSTGKGDAGGASYGAHQLSSKTGTLQSFLSSSGYGQQFAGMKPGTPEFNAKWKQVAKSDPAFAGAQHDFIKRTHFEPQMDALKKSGIDLSGRGEAVREAVWSTSVQFGGNSSLIRKALAGKDVSSLTDQQIVSAIQDYKIANNETLFRSSSEAMRKGTLSRAVSEKGALLATAAKEPAAVPVAQAIAKAPAMPRPAIAAPAPQPEPQASRVNSFRAPAPQAQVMPAGQDVADRTIAHIVTGGIGAPAIGR